MKVLIACHDAGGAEIVSAWIRREGVEWVALLDGPAEDVFSRKFDAVPAWTGSFTITGTGGPPIDLVVCGSSVKSSCEIWAWRFAQLCGVRTAVFLDHWKNYADRFRLADGSLAFPDEVWVTDREAERLAKRELPGAKVVVKGNPYVEEVAEEVWTRSEAFPVAIERILYVAEPLRPDLPPDVLEGLTSRPWGLRVRPHPSVWPPMRSLAEDLAWADVVVGYDSMALAVAVRVGRRVVSLQPPGEELHVPGLIERFFGP